MIMVIKQLLDFNIFVMVINKRFLIQYGWGSLPASGTGQASTANITLPVAHGQFALSVGVSNGTPLAFVNSVTSIVVGTFGSTGTCRYGWITVGSC